MSTQNEKQKCKNEKCKTIFLPDDPQNKDSFGSHQAIANQLYKTLKDGKGGKIISLTGDWGSGKSTVIKLLENKIENNPDELLIIYDAWRHENDPIRRSFLETIYKAIINSNWLPRKDRTKCQDTLDEISGKKKKSITRTRPIISWCNFQILLFALFSPLGLALISATDFSSSLSSNLSFWFGLMLFTIPIIVFIVLTIANYILCSDCNPNIFAIDKAMDTESETLNTPDPTSIEFKHYLKQLYEKVLSDSDRKLVIVIDNLDRITSNKALLIWTTMRTLLDHNDTDVKDVLKNYWVIVPFDKHGMKKIFSVGNNSTENDDLLNSFLNKTFNINFSLPRPILSSWKSAFYELLDEAFEVHDHSEFGIIEKLFKNYIDSTNTNAFPTPRDMILYINKLAVFHYNWCGIIPFCDMALFIRYEESFIKAINNPGDFNFILGHNDRIYASENYLDSFATLYSNLEPEIAVELVLRDRISSNLRANNIEELEKLTVFKEFETVLFAIIEKDYLYLHQDIIVLSAIALSIDNIFIEKNKDKLWEYLKHSFLSINELNTDLNPQIAKGLLCIVYNNKNSEKEILIDQLCTLVGEKYKANTSQEKYMTWLNGIEEIFETLIEKGNAVDLKKRMKYPGNAEFIKYSILNLDQRYLEYVEPGITQEDLMKYIQFILSDMDQVHPSNYEFLSNIVNTPIFSNPKYGFDIIIDIIKNNIKSDAAPKYVGSCIKLLFLYDFNSFKKEIENYKSCDLVKTGVAYNVLLRFLTDDHEVCAYLLISILMCQPNITKLKFGNDIQKRIFEFLNLFLSNPDDKEFVDTNNSIAGILANFNLVEVLITNLHKHKRNRTLLKSLIININCNHNIVDKISPEYFYLNSNNLLKSLGIDNFKSILILYKNNKPFKNIVRKTKFSHNKIEFFIECLKIKDDDFVQFTCKVLRQKFSEKDFKWDDAFNSPHILKLLLLVYDSYRPGLLLGIIRLSFTSSSKEYLGETFGKELNKFIFDKFESNDNISKKSLDEIKRIPNVINRKALPSFINELWENILRLEEVKMLEMIILFEELILNNYHLIEIEDDVLNTLITPILSFGNEKHFLWMEKLFTSNPDIIQDASNEAKIKLSDKINSAFEKHESEKIKSVLGNTKNLIRIN